MKYLLTLALTAVLSLSFVSCNKTQKANTKSTDSADTRSQSADGNAKAKVWLEKTGREIRQAIANGDMTPEEGKAKYQAAEKRMKMRMGKSFESESSDADKRARRTRYQEASDRMAEMVKAGEITREQMQTRLDGMKKRMGADKSKKISKEDYDLAASKMARMVKAGEITREQMDARLNRMKKAMGTEREDN